MIFPASRGITLFFLILQGIDTVTVVDHHPDDEYILEHEVLYEDAIAEAKRLKLYPGPIPGCKACTGSEMAYCKDDSVLNDHCCCDGGYNEVFPFVQHTCRVGPEACKVLAGDCAEYTRLRECCCHAYLGSVWKYLASDASINRINPLIILPILVVLRLIKRVP
ncbi:uncharacterized protein LOC105703235 [Orussus abietinus]|uniref:uncharacterized protein LOC105703235 n=1 Tax=Orussus abietinus TaxID=222816 RepID=UPI000625C37C|nr:uncharacterized protein LOC105703235 [Orussus abietinus]